MKIKAFILLNLFFANAIGQAPESLIPSDAHSVITINNVELLQEISLDELVQYDFMEEVQQELFDGSTNGKNLQDIGIDFDQKMNFFRGENDQYAITGITFGVKNKKNLFETFNDFEKIESGVANVDLYESFFNRIAIQGTSAIFYRLEPHYWVVKEQTDSIWEAQGNSPRWSWGFEEDWEEAIEITIDSMGMNPPPEISEDDENYEEITIGAPPAEEEVVTEILSEEEIDELNQVASEKTYNELRDSVEMEVIAKLSQEFTTGLFSEEKTLIKSDPKFIKKLNSPSEAVFYFDNERMTNYSSGRPYTPLYGPIWNRMERFSKNNYVSGALNFKENQVVLDVDYNYSEDLGKIYTAFSDSKFDKKILKYIPEDNQGFFTYNVNMQEAHDKTLELMEEMFGESKSRQAQSSLLMMDIWKELVNTEALFDTYRGSLFGSYHGIQKIKTKKIVFDYDEETFEYNEREEEAEEDLPIFSFGISTKNREFVEKILSRMSRIEDDITFEGNFWRVDNAVVNSVPLFIIPTDNAIILTNDEDQAFSFYDGYGKLALNKKRAKNAVKSGVMYAEVDVRKAIDNLPKAMFSSRENEMLDVLRKNVGSFVLTSDKTTVDKMSYSISYNYDGKDNSFGTYVLDLINSLYNVTK